MNRQLHRTGVMTAFLALLGGAQAQSGPSYLELILDSSGSMYTRLDSGQTRIAAAQAVLNDVIGRLPADPNLNVGLRVYGAKTAAGDPNACQDSELVQPMQGIERQKMLNVVNAAKPKGATPIALSLQKAIDDFPNEAGKKLIILVTDGQESCRGDLKAWTAAAKAKGIDVDLRIVGIDLDARAQQSFSGVGTFVNTRTAGELASALGSAVQQVAKPSAQKVPVTVTLTAGGKPLASGPTVTFTSSVSNAASDPFQNSGGEYTAQLLPGGYSATVKTATDTQTFGGLTVSLAGPNNFTFDVTQVGAVNLKVTPAVPVAGGTVKVSFSGAPKGEKNWITIARKTDPDSVYLDWKYVQGATGELELNVPDDESAYEARYHLANPDGSTRVIGRSAVFTPKRQTASVSGPASVVAGAKIQVKWTGPNNPGDYVTVVPQGAAADAYLAYFYTKNANPGSLETPPTPGDYELRYVGGSQRVMASMPIKLTAGSYALQAPASAQGGSTLQVKWTGPNNSGDYVTIVKKGAPVGTYTTYFYTRDGNPGKLKLPVSAGDYEIRYSTEKQSPNPTLASIPLKVLGASYGLEAPSSGKAKGKIQVKWKGPNNSGDYVTIVKKGAPVGSYLFYFYTRDGNPGTLQLPDQPGEYELRYSTEAESPNPTLYSMPFTVK